MISSTIQVTFDRDDAVAEKSQMRIKSAYPNITVEYFGTKRHILKVSCGKGFNLDHLESYMASTVKHCGGKEVKV